MGDLQLPGDIPTIPAVVNGHVLVRGCSPVKNTAPTDLGWEDTEVPAGTQGVILYADESNDLAWVSFVDCDKKGPILMPVPLDDLSLRLDDPTGRAHAAWWLRTRHHGDWKPVADAIGEVWTRCELAHRWAAMGVRMPADLIDTLRRIVLHVAGRTP